MPDKAYESWFMGNAGEVFRAVAGLADMQHRSCCLGIGTHVNHTDLVSFRKQVGKVTDKISIQAVRLSRIPACEDGDMPYGVQGSAI